MNTVLVRTKIVKSTNNEGEERLEIMKTFTTKSLPFSISNDVEGTYSLDRSNLQLPSWATFSQKDYEYTVKLKRDLGANIGDGELLCISATTPGLVDKVAARIFQKYMDNDMYVTKRDLGEHFTFRKRKVADEESEISPFSLFSTEDY